MKVYQTNEIKNISILGSSGSGKTTLAEAMLYEGGVIKRRGSVESGNTVSDYFPVEKEYGYSVFSTVFSVEWQDRKLNFIDCPGSDDFIGGAVSALNVTDTALMVLNAQYGVEVGTINQFRYTEQFHKPVIFVVNQLDNDKADYDGTIAQLREQWGGKVVPIQYPVSTGSSFNAVVDVLKMKMYRWKPEGGVPEVLEIPAEEMDKAMELHKALVESAAEHDDMLMEKFFEDPDSITVDELKAALRKAVCDNKIVPVCCGTAFKNKGVQLLLNNVVDYMPSPVDVKAIEGELEDGTKTERHSSDDEPFSALSFKVMTDPFVGRLTFLRVYSGVITSGSYVLNSTNGKKERISRLVRMYADQRLEENEVYAGDICAAVGLKDTTTGDTLCDEKAPIILERMTFPEPVISVAIEPKTKADQDKMGIALQKLAEEDPSFRVKSDSETGQTIISGMGELHLDIIVDRMLREFKVEANIGKPQVAYRETIRGNADQDSKFVRQSGGKGQYGHVKIRISPAEENAGFVFENKIVGGAIPKEYIEPARKGMEEALEGGILAGYPMIDVKVELYDGSYHEVDSSEMAFKIAGSMAIKDGTKKAQPCILEPMMKVEIEIPDEFTGTIIGDISRRRGRVEGQEPVGNTGNVIVRATVPLANMFGYATDLRSNTQGRGTFSMEFQKYEQVPANIEKEIIEKAGAAQK